MTQGEVKAYLESKAVCWLCKCKASEGNAFVETYYLGAGDDGDPGFDDIEHHAPVCAKCAMA